MTRGCLSFSRNIKLNPNKLYSITPLLFIYGFESHAELWSALKIIAVVQGSVTLLYLVCAQNADYAQKMGQLYFGLSHPLAVPCGSAPGPRAECGCRELCWPAVIQGLGAWNQLVLPRAARAFWVMVRELVFPAVFVVAFVLSVPQPVHRWSLCVTCSAQRSPVWHKGGSLKMFCGLFFSFLF